MTVVVFGDAVPDEHCVCISVLGALAWPAVRLRAPATLAAKLSGSAAALPLC